MEKATDLGKKSKWKYMKCTGTVKLTSDYRFLAMSALIIAASTENNG